MTAERRSTPATDRGQQPQRSAPARVVVIDHRRVKDGGKTKRQQLREARPA